MKKSSSIFSQKGLKLNKYMECETPDRKESENMKKSKKKTPLILKILACAFAGYAAFTLVNLQININHKHDEIAKLDAQISEKSTINQELRDFLKSGASDEYIADIAREKLGYVSPGERVFVDTSSK
jgi:cell division protein FtsB